MGKEARTKIVIIIMFSLLGVIGVTLYFLNNEGNNADSEGNNANIISELSRDNALVYDEKKHVIRKFLDLERYFISPNDHSIYPGCIIRGDSLFNPDKYLILDTRYDGLNIFCNITGSEKKVIDDVSYSLVYSAVDEYINGYDGQNTKEWEYFLQKIESSEEERGALGIKNIGLDASGKKAKTRLAVVYQKVFFTVIAEPLQDYSNYFSNLIDSSSIGNYEPAVVSSIDYGSRVVVLIEGNMSYKEINSRLGIEKGNLSLGALIKGINETSELNCSIYGYGGDLLDISNMLSKNGNDAGLIEKWKELINGKDEESAIEDEINRELSNSSNNNPVPIAYEINYVTDNAPVERKVLESEIIIDESQAATVYIKKSDVDKYSMEKSFEQENVALTFDSSDNIGVVLKNLSDGFTLYYKGLIPIENSVQLTLNSGKDTYKLDSINNIEIDVREGVNLTH